MKKAIKSILASIIRKLCWIAAYKGIIPRDNFIDIFPHDKVETKYGSIIFYAPSTVIHWRSKTFFEKEPETLAWIDSFEPGGLFWDIGANVGLYALYAARKGHDVFAFEPVYQNTFVLSRNIYLNGLDDKIKPLPVALARSSKIDDIFMQRPSLGEAENSFGIDKDWRGVQYNTVYRQGTVGFSIDDFLSFFKAKVPAYIKVDVDGLEYEIVYGMSCTLMRPELKEILLELCIDDERYPELLAFLLKNGFILKYKKHSTLFDGTEYKNVYNHVFCRQDALQGVDNAATK